jgi:hypothetical protein
MTEDSYFLSKYAIYYIQNVNGAVLQGASGPYTTPFLLEAQAKAWLLNQQEGPPAYQLYKIEDGQPIATGKSVDQFPNAWSVKQFKLPETILDVPYLPQWGPTANVRKGDCGPACVAMITHFLTDQRPTVNQAADACGQPASGPGASYTGHKQLRDGAAAYAWTLETRSPYTEKYDKPKLTTTLMKEQVDAGLPSIALIHYGVLRDQTNELEGYVKNQDQNYDRGHWVTFVGYDSESHIYIHDPDYWGARQQDGNTRKIPETEFHQALSTKAPGCSVGYQGLIVADQ